MSYTPMKAGTSIPMFNQLAPMMGFALGASGLLPKLIGKDAADKLSANLSGEKPQTIPMTTLPQQSQQSPAAQSFADKNAVAALAPATASPAPTPVTAPDPYSQVPQGALPPQARGGLAPSNMLSPGFSYAPPAAPAPPPPDAPTPPPAGAPMAAPTATPQPTSQPQTDAGQLNPQAKMLLASLTGQGGLGGLGGLGGGQANNLMSAFAPPKPMEMPNVPQMPQMQPPAMPNPGQQLAMAGGRNQFGAPMGPAAMNPIYMLQRRMMGLA